jgi:hypothetical protein
MLSINVDVLDVLFIDTLEHNILQELHDTEDKIKSKIDNRLKQLSRNSKTVEGLFFIISSILFLITVKFCSMLSINVDVLDVLFISRIDKSPTQSLWCIEIQSGQQGLSWC